MDEAMGGKICSEVPSFSYFFNFSPILVTQIRAIFSLILYARAAAGGESCSPTSDGASARGPSPPPRAPEEVVLCENPCEYALAESPDDNTALFLCFMDNHLLSSSTSSAGLPALSAENLFARSHRRSCTKRGSIQVALHSGLPPPLPR